MTKDLTKGSIYKLMIQFLIPVILGQFLQQVYSLADTAIVGRTLGVIALGGVGSTGSLSFLVIGFCDGLCSGFALPVAQAFGAGDEKRLRRYVANAVYLSAVLAVLLVSVFRPLTGKLLEIMHTPAEQYEYAYRYISVIFSASRPLYFTTSRQGSSGASETPGHRSSSSGYAQF